MDFKLFLVLALSFAWVQPLTVQPSIQNGNFDEKTPLEEDEDVTLVCLTDEEFSTCMWTHAIEDQYDSNGQQMTFACTTGGGQHSSQCENNGGSEELDSEASRMQISSTTSACSLRISSAAIDDGKWRCHISKLSQTVIGELDLHVANKSYVVITEPDLWQDPHAVVEYQIDDTRAEIEATCTAYGGKPVPEFHWYIEDGSDDRNEITNPDSVRNMESSDDLGDYIQQRMTWSPTRDDLCDFNEIENICDDYDFSFNLVCKVVQSSGSKVYYERENDQENAEQTVLVDVKGGQSALLASIAMLLISFVLTRL